VVLPACQRAYVRCSVFRYVQPYAWCGRAEPKTWTTPSQCRRGARAHVQRIDVQPNGFHPDTAATRIQAAHSAAAAACLVMVMLVGPRRNSIRMFAGAAWWRRQCNGNERGQQHGVQSRALAQYRALGRVDL